MLYEVITRTDNCCTCVSDIADIRKVGLVKGFHFGILLPDVVDNQPVKPTAVLIGYENNPFLHDWSNDIGPSFKSSFHTLTPVSYNFV